MINDCLGGPGQRFNNVVVSPILSLKPHAVAVSDLFESDVPVKNVNND